MSVTNDTELWLVMFRIIKRTFDSRESLVLITITCENKEKHT